MGAVGHTVGRIAAATMTLGASEIGGAKNPIQQAVNAVTGAFDAPKAPDQANPDAGAPPPTQAAASTTAIQNQLSKEQNSAATSTMLTSGQGLLDQPTTTSKVLIGQ